MTDTYPVLTQMGVTNPEQIVSYTLSSIDKNRDQLRLRYGRPAGSLLPVTRSYEFDRVPRPAHPESSAAFGLIDHEIAPFLNEALIELDQLLRRQGGRSDLVDDVLGHIAQLEGDLAELRAKVNRLKAAE